MNMNTSAVSTFQGKTISFDYRRTDNVIPLEVVKTGESYILGFVGDAIRVYHYLGDKKHIRTAAKELQASLEQEVGLVAECGTLAITTVLAHRGYAELIEHRSSDIATVMWVDDKNQLQITRTSAASGVKH